MNRTPFHATSLALVAILAACAPHPCDGLSAARCEQVRALAMPASLPPARGNAHADDPSAAELGFRIFFDSRFSSNLEVRCATCHAPEKAFADGLAVSSTTLGTVTRNAPTAFNAAAGTWMMWDGRADSVWSQALIPLENPAEMGFTRLGIAHRIALSYQALYEAAFGPLPDLSDPARFPAAGKPGDAAFDAMAPEDQDAVNRIAANVGKAMEAYQRKLFARESKLDAFLGGDGGALTGGERQGLAVLANAGCLECHGGPYLTDDGFHRLGVPGADRGRAAGLEALAASELRLDGKYSDDPSAFQPPPSPSAADEGAFKTPSLRNLARTAPYGHDGSFAALEDVVDFHLQGGGSGADPLLQPRALSGGDRAALLELLRSLEGADPGRPWDYWPEG